MVTNWLFDLIFLCMVIIQNVDNLTHTQNLFDINIDSPTNIQFWKKKTYPVVMKKSITNQLLRTNVVWLFALCNNC